MRLGLGEMVKEPRYRRAKSELFRTSIATRTDVALFAAKTVTSDVNRGDSKRDAMNEVEEW